MTLKIIVFDIKGRFAHFRKFYTNSSSLTYGIPPRTTLAGIVAAILGYERDSYYDILGADKLYITSKKMTKTSKIIQSLNYIRADSIRDIINPKLHTQIPFEMLTGDEGVCFRVYLSHNDNAIFNEIEERLINRNFAYPPSLGAVNFLSNISYINTIEGNLVKENNHIEISTPIRTDCLKDIKVDGYIGKVIRERMAVDFNSERMVSEVANYIYDDTGKTIYAMVSANIYKSSEGENILFM